jgi:DNA-binding winged helix-turn-helix (wHTH) protein
MRNHPVESRVLRFGPFELDRETGELRKNGIRVRLQGKPLQVLLALLELPGEVVSREELKRRLWGEDTFVDFESGLNTAANRLRLTLGDSADQPRYVETLARAGYRFIAPVGEIGEATQPAAGPVSARPHWQWAAITLAALGLSVAVLWLVLPSKAAPPVSFQQITYRRGPLWSARFAPDGQTILYSARWEGEPWRMFLSNRASPEVRAVGYEQSLLNAVSRSGELAVVAADHAANSVRGDLFRVPMNGGSPLTVTHGVTAADWSADGRQLVVIRIAAGEAHIELPPGNIIYRASGLLSCVRVSRDGSRIAFVEHPVSGDDGGMVRVADLHGSARTLSEGWPSVAGLAWSADGNEVWFTASRTGAVRSLWAVSLNGALRPVAKVPGSIRLHDISRSGAVLVSYDNARAEMAGRFGDETAERDLSWFDWSGAQDLSRDGTRLLFDESGEGGGANWTVYLRDLRDGSTVRLGEGRALALDPEARWAVTLPAAEHSALTLVETQGGATRQLPKFGLEYHWARVFPGGKKLLVAASQPDTRIRLYVYPLDGSKPQPLMPEAYVRSATISPDGRFLAGGDNKGNLLLIPIDGAATRAIPCPEPAMPVQWSADGTSILARSLSGFPVQVYRIHLASGRATVWRSIAPAYSVGAQAMLRLQIAPDERTYAYSFTRTFSQLYLATGWR